MSRLTSREILDALEVEPDGLVVRQVNVWTLEKLAIIFLYLRAFTSASTRAGGGVFVDGFAGPGICQVRGAIARPEFVRGSPILGMRADPPFQDSYLIELGKANAQALEARSVEQASRRVVVQDDVNVVLPQLMTDTVHPRAPCFCLLDPEGMELRWSTVRATALAPSRRRKPELLVLVPSSWLLRLLPRKGKMNPRHEEILDQMMPSRHWRTVYQERLSGLIAPGEAKDQYVELYRAGLEELGYTAFSHPISAPTKPGERRRERYQLVFATEHVAGERIMTDVFKRPYVLDFPVSSQPPLFE